MTTLAVRSAGRLARFRAPALAAGLGALAATGLAPLGWAWVSLAAWAAALAWLARIPRWQVAALRGWALGTGWFAAALFWIVDPFLVEPERYGWMAPFALVLLAGGMALYWALAAGLAARLGRDPRRRVLLLVALLTLAEMLRSVLFTGFPWALIGHIWIGWPQMQAAALVGAPGLTLLTLLAAAMPALVGARRALLGAIAGAALMSLPALYGTLRTPPGPAPVVQPAVTVRLVQPNAAQALKWLPEMIPVFFDRQIALTSAPPAPGGARPDIVVWSETAVPDALDYAGPALDAMARAAAGAEVITGIQRQDQAGRWYNSLVVIDPDGQVTALYDKHHLVPFGEYMPFMELFARWGVFGLAANDTGGFSSGPGPQLIDLGHDGRALPLICYEAIFPQDIARAPGRADWMVQITNDAWFGALSGPYQHLAIARLRAVEQGLPLLRSASTGVSAVIDPWGRIVASVPLGEAGFADAALPAPLAPPPYVRLGDAPVGAALLALVTLALVGRRRPASG